eukprot:TRINITY_DN722_c0_g1_i1.p1 TRINITY_DN722_c0_g1~~TRINITY_DN722_c0_g1_i1.p1  ORF type:complete len:100 (-),score=38.83 TRINITY_DN722_c0_g1_i1:166-465(-)
MASHHTPDTRKEEFRKYLEKTGVIDTMTRVLVALYEEQEQPANPLDYIKEYLGDPSGGDSKSLKDENEQLKNTVRELEEELRSLKEAAQDGEKEEPAAE